ncbi:hypothetical protein Q426_05935 [Streptococcus equi subsp. zooepidemicus CY]|nr:hypothetical protein Q426_05935 [Streptococcus equi subsp. zooepidemicus CY]
MKRLIVSKNGSLTSQAREDRCGSLFCCLELGVIVTQ